LINEIWKISKASNPPTSDLGLWLSETKAEANAYDVRLKVCLNLRIRTANQNIESEPAILNLGDNYESQSI